MQTRALKPRGSSRDIMQTTLLLRLCYSRAMTRVCWQVVNFTYDVVFQQRPRCMPKPKGNTAIFWYGTNTTIPGTSYKKILTNPLTCFITQGHRLLPFSDDFVHPSDLEKMPFMICFPLKMDSLQDTILLPY